MTSIPRQLATFAGVLAVLYSGGYVAGRIIDEDPPRHGEMETTHGAERAPEPAHGTGHGSEAAEAAEAHGLSSTENGLRLSVDTSDIRPGRAQDIAFAVLDETGAPVTDYDVTHTKRMHMILVRRDTTGFQHLHPRQDESGRWRARTTVDEPGSYRLFADFSHAGTKTTLAGDLLAGQDGDVRPLPASEPLAETADGYSVRIDADDVAAGEETTLSFTAHRDGRAVRTQPYLGAGGHLVALREGDLAYLHVHPVHGEGEAISFETAFPSAGRYRLFLQFKHAGRVQTAAFTHEVR